MSDKRKVKTDEGEEVEIFLPEEKQERRKQKGDDLDDTEDD